VAGSGSTFLPAAGTQRSFRLRFSAVMPPRPERLAAGENRRRGARPRRDLLRLGLCDFRFRTHDGLSSFRNDGLGRPAASSLAGESSGSATLGSVLIAKGAGATSRRGETSRMLRPADLPSARAAAFPRIAAQPAENRRLDFGRQSKSSVDIFKRVAPNLSEKTQPHARGDGPRRKAGPRLRHQTARAAMNCPSCVRSLLPQPEYRRHRRRSKDRLAKRRSLDAVTVRLDRRLRPHRAGC